MSDGRNEVNQNLSTRTPAQHARGVALLASSHSLRMALCAAATAAVVSTVQWSPSTEGSSTAPGADVMSAMDAPMLLPGTALRAAPLPSSGSDLDGDGLPDAQELILRTDRFNPDTDGDGFGDGEEFARQSDPLLDSSVPGTSLASAALTARGEGGKLRLVLIVHEPEFQFGDALIRLGVLAGDEVLSVPIARLVELGDVIEVSASNNSQVTSIDVPIDPQFVHNLGGVSFFVASGSFNAQILATAAKIDVLSDGSMLILQNSPRVNTVARQASQGGGVIRQPLPVTNIPPPAATWIPGAVCFQRTEVIGVNGARMLHQIVEADCVEGWDSFCASDCSAAVGDSYETVDPWSLLGN